MGLLLNVAGGRSAHRRAVPRRVVKERVTGPPRIVIAAGGTAGHVVPAIAVADALRAEGAEVTFVGGERAEAELVPKAGYELDRDQRRRHQPHEPAEGRPRRWGRREARSAPRARSSSAAAADAVLGGGGYVAGPVGLAATLAKIPLVLSEADSHLGLTNRALASRARRVCLAFPLEGCDGDRYRVTGRARAADLRRPRARPRPARHRPGRDLRADLRRLARRALDQPRRRRGVHGRAVPRHPRRRHARLRRASRRPAPHYVLLDYLTPFGVALAAADAAVARAGGSVFELAQYGLPAVLIPYPHASARPPDAPTRAGWRSAGAARVLPDAELTPARLREEATRSRSTPAACARWRAPPRGSPSPTPPARSRPRCSRRHAEARRGAARAAPLDLVRGSTDRWPGLPLSVTVSTRPRPCERANPAFQVLEVGARDLARATARAGGRTPRPAVSSARSRTTSSASVL